MSDSRRAYTENLTLRIKDAVSFRSKRKIRIIYQSVVVSAIRGI